MSILMTAGWLCRGLIAGGCFSFAIFCQGAGQAGLNPLADKPGPLALELRGKGLGLAPGERLYLSHEQLARLPVDEVEAQVWTNPGIPSRLEIVYLADLMKALGLGDEIDFVLADCVDGFQANYTRDQIEAYRPYLILTIEGAGPEEWAYQNGLLRYGPHYLRIAEPGQLLDPESKMPFGVTRLRFARFAAMAAEFYESPWEDLEDTAARGREIYMNACVNCHALDQRSSFGGEKSSSLLRTLAIQAESQQAYFKGVVRHPARILGSQDMTAFPHYTEAEFEALFAFLGRY